MEQNEMQSKLVSVLAEEFEVDASTIDIKAPLMETLGLDSLDMIDVAVIIEKNFGVVMTQDDFKELVTFEDFFALLQKKMQK